MSGTRLQWACKRPPDGPDEPVEIFFVQSNLKFARQFAATPHIVVDFRGADLHKQLERAALQRLLEHFHAAGTSSACSSAQPLNSPYTKVQIFYFMLVVTLF